MIKILKLSLVLIITGVSPDLGQAKLTELLTNSIRLMKAIEFDSWVNRKREEYESAKIKPVLLKEELIKRLKEEDYTFNSSILSVVAAWKTYESGHIDLQKRFEETIELIDKILTLLNDQIQLKAQLNFIKAEIIKNSSQQQDAIRSYEKAQLLIGTLSLEVDKARIENMLNLADLQLGINEKEQAEKLYLDILSYPWYLIENPGYFQLLRQYYLQAGKGLIECRRGDWESLQNTFFVPATNEILKPILDKAIKDAKK